MPKIRTAFFCQSCGAQSSKWIGKCPSCGNWNTYVEEPTTATPERQTWKASGTVQTKPIALTQINQSNQVRLLFKDNELNRVLGGGAVVGSLVLLGGEPGVGKSTLMLQAAQHLEGKKILYVSGEESEQQIRLRADRVGNMQAGCFILTEISLNLLFVHLKNFKPDLVIIDSIQTLFNERIESAPGSVSQIRDCTGELLRYAKESGVPVFLIGHITKDGSIAGPKVLEHMVDVVLQFEGDRHHVFRILRCSKNRFGSSSEIGIYEMSHDGLRGVANPSEMLLSHRNENFSGVSIAATMDGLRTIMIEAQALVSSAVYGVPQRSTTGFNIRRLNMLLAVLEKRCGFRLGAKDVFLNIAGGIRVDDPAIDLAVICAVLSSNGDIPVHQGICFAGEVGLSGEIRPVNRIAQRISEAERLGFSKFFLSKHNLPSLESGKTRQIELIGVRSVEEVFTGLFDN